MKRLLCLTTLALMVSLGTARAAVVDGIDVGPLTPYGETPAEGANKLVLFKMNKLIAEGKADEAFTLYVSKDVCDHSHMVTHGKRECGTYDEMLATFHGMGSGQKNMPAPSANAPHAAAAYCHCERRDGHYVRHRRRYLPCS